MERPIVTTFSKHNHKNVSINPKTMDLFKAIKPYIAIALLKSYSRNNPNLKRMCIQHKSIKLYEYDKLRFGNIRYDYMI